MIMAAVKAAHGTSTKETMKSFIIDKHKVDWSKFGKNFNHNIGILVKMKKLIASTNGYILNTK